MAIQPSCAIGGTTPRFLRIASFCIVLTWVHSCTVTSHPLFLIRSIIFWIFVLFFKRLPTPPGTPPGGRSPRTSSVASVEGRSPRSSLVSSLSSNLSSNAAGAGAGREGLPQQQRPSSVATIPFSLPQQTAELSAAAAAGLMATDLSSAALSNAAAATATTDDSTPLPPPPPTETAEAAAAAAAAESTNPPPAHSFPAFDDGSSSGVDVSGTPLSPPPPYTLSAEPSPSNSLSNHRIDISSINQTRNPGPGADFRGGGGHGDGLYGITRAFTGATAATPGSTVTGVSARTIHAVTSQIFQPMYMGSAGSTPMYDAPFCTILRSLSKSFWHVYN